jgi:hypothetical protein
VPPTCWVLEEAVASQSGFTSINRDFRSESCSCRGWLHRPKIEYRLEIPSGKNVLAIPAL